MRNLFSILIFLSLAIAIGVIGRHLPEIKGYFKKRKTTGFRNFFLVVFLVNLAKKVGSLFLVLAETTIKKFKNLLHLAHFWLIKLKNRKQASEELREIEAKMELLEEEERTLEKVINEDLGREEEDALSEKEYLAEKFKKRSLIEADLEFSSEAEEFILEKKKIVLEKEDDQKEQVADVFEDKEFEKEEQDLSRKQVIDQKINQFFSPESGKNFSSEEERFSAEEELSQEEVFSQNNDNQEQVFAQPLANREREEKQSFFSNLASKFKLGAFKKKPDWEKEEDYPAEDIESEEDFSDGIVKVGEVSGTDNEKSRFNNYQEESNLIKEVVKVDKKREEYSDEDLGIDREILERKIIAKISANPKDQENYRQLGDLYLKMENFRDAEECYRQILKIKPRDIAAKRKLEKVRLLKRLRQR